MSKENKETTVNREKLIELLNEDLSREYQAIISYVIYSQTIKGAAFNHIASELELHAAEELSHALLIAKQVDYLGGTPTKTPKEVKLSDKAEEMLKFDLKMREDTIRHYRCRIRQADALEGRPRRSAAKNYCTGTGPSRRPGGCPWNRCAKNR